MEHVASYVPTVSADLSADGLAVLAAPEHAVCAVPRRPLRHSNGQRRMRTTVFTLPSWGFIIESTGELVVKRPATGVTLVVRAK